MTVDFSAIPQSSWSGRLSRRMLKLVPRGLVVPVLQGPMRGARWAVGLGTNGCWLGTYELDLQSFLASELGAGMVFWDVGANVGFFALLGARRVGTSGRVVAVEPVPANVEGLRRIVRLNHLGELVRLVEAAVGSADTLARFDPSPGPSEGKLDEGGDLSVRVLRLDSLLDQGYPAPTVVKMDIEGGEVEALRGARRLLADFRPVLCVATHGHSNDLSCRNLLQATGFTVRNLEGRTGPVGDVLVARPA